MTNTVSGQQGQSPDQGRDGLKNAKIGPADDRRIAIERSRYSKRRSEQGVRFDPMDHWGKE
jgi:hypothetical protein